VLVKFGLHVVDGVRSLDVQGDAGPLFFVCSVCMLDVYCDVSVPFYLLHGCPANGLKKMGYSPLTSMMRTTPSSSSSCFALMSVMSVFIISDFQSKGVLSYIKNISFNIKFNNIAFNIYFR